MIKMIKKVIMKIMTKNMRLKIEIYSKLNRNNRKIIEMIKYIFKAKIYKGKNIKKLFTKITLGNIDEKDKFYFNIDLFKFTYSNIGNLSIDYNIILNNSLLDFKKLLEQNKQDKKFYTDEINVIEGIEILIDRIVNKFNKMNLNKQLINNIKNIKDKKAQTFYEALQRILFFNQLLWQTYHGLNGLGRLDMILISYYKNDIERGIISKNEARQLLKQFLITLHKYYKFKSNILLGDTGQIIELGGKDVKGKYIYNELTYIIIELMQELQLPDPKILLRVSSNMPKSLMEKSLRCIQTGIGCPLFANDDVIIDKLIKFGYKKEDAYNYGTSACWEPYIIGKSLDQNNIKSINFIEPLDTLLRKEKLEEIENIQQLIEKYKIHLEKYINVFIKKTKKIKWQKDPLLSLFIEDCIKNNKDLANGGAIYNNYGFTGVGLPNLINSLINLELMVFKNKQYKFNEINEIRKNNFINNEKLLNKLKNEKLKYGTDNDLVIGITNDIIRYTTQLMSNFTNSLGGSYKFGLSSPNYIVASENFPASFDGRKIGEAFAVHISSDTSNAYTELMQFAAKLDYGENRFNGNVVDFMVSPSFIENNFDKFVDFLLLSVKNGFFEMQMNVVSSKTLIEARKDPEKFPNLIVRVWGFSAYFNDLPDSYKDNLIERALQSEKR